MPPAMQAGTIRRWLPWIAKLVVCVSLIGYLLASIGVEGAWTA